MTRFTDHADDWIEVREFSDPLRPGVAFEINDGEVVQLPPHKVPEFCRAVYEAAGLPVPDLPQICDPALVTELAGLLYFAREGTRGPHGRADEECARVLLAHGWRKP